MCYVYTCVYGRVLDCGVCALYVERMCVVCACIACMYMCIVCSWVVGAGLVMFWRYMVGVRYVCI